MARIHGRKSLPLTAAIIVLLTMTSFAVAQENPAANWSEPTAISDLPSTVGGALVTGDGADQVYVVWFANSEGKGQDLVDTVYFRQWGGERWSPSVDILAVPPDTPSIRVDGFELDPFGRLVLLWHRDRVLNVSIANPAEAGSAKGWRTTPVLDGQLIYQSSLVSGPDGALHVLAVGEQQNIYYIRSRDAGKSWDVATVSAGADPDRQYSWGSLALDQDGTLYASWTENRAQDNWDVGGIYVTQSTDGGTTWSQPRALVSTRGHGHSSLTTDADGAVMVLWNHAVGSVDGRYYARSTNHGTTWQTPRVAYEGVSGLNRPAVLFTDSLGQLHMIGAGYGNGSENIWYSSWDTGAWGVPEPITVTGRSMVGNEVFDARLVNGNHLLYVWTDASTKDIWFTSQKLPGPRIAMTVISRPSAAPVATSQPLVNIESTAIASPTPLRPSATVVSVPPEPVQDSTLRSMLIGMAAAALLVGAVVLVRALRSR